ncbi:peptidylprolyl isomerase [Streptococcus alactolyticus]|jgi:peptidyl-prolyl cis-trans isomerase A (cyclophilin A)|uniref:Peptidyl-prolyl cis-trans isomerase n=2 Tax=Bacteria TaxID=2 RepID=A0A6N7X4G1_STRAY|nr:peptidylprolyl isomerase [Streptococcus alactolyticus]MDE2587720.1 peptidylprolyl isomerase [Lactobacillales bacterium]MCF2665602.1 peptidylprolyl isomerase [Streptococcus alactolyticus]MCF2677649.1 peptidylprolyl isomerase [Streptococcus alactolyticus]MST54297.1 peptidylprolyl isomerase [Streptococcus alactolyticus]WBB06022.1 peptidylprolyl isomerase [Streptococcus alactolyticus]
MKKTIPLLVIMLSLVSLSGCSQLTKAIRGEDYVNAKASASAASASKSASASSSKAYPKELKKALSADTSAFPQLSNDVTDNESEVLMHTSEGDITIKLFPKYAPLAVENFLTHAKEGYYNGVLFHRVISDFMIQSGDPKGDGTGGESIWKNKDKSIDSGNGFKNEISPYLYNIRGAVAMANAGADTNGSQFFINQNTDDQSQKLSSSSYPEPIIGAYAKGGNPSLDGNYTVFGQVIDGMDVVDKIAQTATDDNDKPTTDVTITSIDILKDSSSQKD